MVYTSFKTSLLSSGLILAGPKLLVLKRARPYKEIELGKGYWEFPGGKWEEGESAEEALCREVFEETSLAITQWHAPFEKLCRLRKENLDSVRHHYFFRSELDKKPEITLSEEHLDARWVDRTQLQSLEMFSCYREVGVAALQDYGRNLQSQPHQEV